MSSSMSMFDCEDGIAGGWSLSLYKVERVCGAEDQGRSGNQEP